MNAPIDSHDIMDCAEVAEHLGVSMSSIQVALAAPHRHPALAARLPAPFRKIGRSWVWRRTDIELMMPADVGIHCDHWFNGAFCCECGDDNTSDEPVEYGTRRGVCPNGGGECNGHTR